MTLFYQLLYQFLNKDIYLQYQKTLPLERIKASYPIIYKMFLSLFKLQDSTDRESSSVDDLRLIFQALYPNENEKEVDIVFKHLERDGSTSKKDTVLSYLRILEARLIAYDIARLGISVADGDKDPADLHSLMQDVLGRLEKVSTDTVVFVSDDLEQLYNETIKERGHRWRLQSLNEALGSLRLGDFGFIFARPETGKTTWLASECTFMAEHLGPNDGPILWFNNEEQGNKVMLRCYQACLDKTTKEIFVDIPKAKEEFNKRIKHKLLIYDNANLSRREVEEIIKQTNPSLIIFDQIDKIKGFDADRDDLKLGAIYIWARELAKTYAPVIGVCQADGTGEGVKALTMSHVANAKTAKQAEADWILGIGKSHKPDEQLIRYFHLSKNKLIGDEDTDPNRRHDLWEVELDAPHARYRDFTHQDDYYSSRS